MVTPRCARASGAAGADAELERAAVARELGDALVEVVGDGAQASRALTWGFSLGSRLRLSLVIAVCPVRKIDQMRTARTRATPAIAAM